MGLQLESQRLASLGEVDLALRAIDWIDNQRVRDFVLDIIAENWLKARHPDWARKAADKMGDKEERSEMLRRCEIISLV